MTACVTTATARAVPLMSSSGGSMGGGVEGGGGAVGGGGDGAVSTACPTVTLSTEHQRISSPAPLAMAVVLSESAKGGESKKVKAASAASASPRMVTTAITM